MACAATAFVAGFFVMGVGVDATEGRQCGSGNAAEVAVSGEPRVALGHFAVVNEPIPAGSLILILEPGSRYMRLRIELLKPGCGDWVLTLRDGEYRPIQTMDRSSFGPLGRDGKASRWSARIPGAQVWLELSTHGQAPTLRAAERVAVPKDQSIPYYSARDPQNPRYHDLFPVGTGSVHTSSASRVQGDGVGLFIATYGQFTWCCSGVVVAPDLFLTNWHCGGPTQLAIADYWLPPICKNAIIDLSWDGDAVSRNYGCVSVVAADRGRDFALLRMAPVDGGPARPTQMRSTPPEVGEPVTVIHHPGCRAKQISDDCTVQGRNVLSAMGGGAIDFTHDCDTAAGSSGGAVFDAAGRLLGLQHLGYLPRPDGTCDDVNKAVGVPAIVARIKATDSGTAAELEVVTP